MLAPIFGRNERVMSLDGECVIVACWMASDGAVKYAVQFVNSLEYRWMPQDRLYVKAIACAASAR